jgi:aspartyl-tRNA(Asn)/glutamyl-tRNA(Gln) amidotransferase subunit B
VSESNASATYEPVIGLEVHAQLQTLTKAFCGCSTTFGQSPNTNVCPVCLGLPGTLPVLNKRVVEFAVRMGLATHCTIAARSVFARKNYFYPDLPKGYQISQYEAPICTNGYVEIDLPDGTRKRIGLRRVHMEEDAGKSLHDVGPDTLVDLNRCGVPLIEIVTEPDIRSPHEAALVLGKLRQIVMYLGICDGNMEEGSLRCDANVSVRRRGDTALGVKTEVKNLNSLRFVERALAYEVERQMRLLDAGDAILQETLLWDADRGVTYSMRSKEEAHDYRYFPEPDLLPVVVDQQWQQEIARTLPEHPTARRDRFIASLGLPRYDADVLTAEQPIADYFEQTLDALAKAADGDRPELAKQVSNWVMTDVLRVMSERTMDVRTFPIQPERLAAMIQLIREGTISGKIAKDVFEEMLTNPNEPKTIVKEKGWIQVSDADAIARAIDEVLAQHRQQVAQYLAGSDKLFGFFVGETMKKMKGKANPSLVNRLLKEKLQR